MPFKVLHQTMKQKVITLSLLASMALTASATIHMTGKINNYSGGNVLLIQMSDTAQQSDTMAIAKDGSFVKDIQLLEPGIAYFGLEDKKAFCQVFLEDGIKFNVNITENKRSNKKGKGNETKEMEKATFEYEGDDKDCYEYLKTHDMFNLFDAWPFDRLDTISFRSYRQLWTADVEAYKVAANQVKSLAFRRMMNERLAGFATSELFRWVWSDNKSHATDKDFVAWVESIDHNDPNQLDFCSNYLRWYGKAHADEDMGADRDFTILTKAFQNQDIINTLADNQILEFLRQAPEDMESMLATYKKVSTNKEAWKEADEVFAHYVKLKKDSVAADFTMTDKNGKVVSLKDLRGKAVYIDCWATWCGPCCMEIPYMEKLYEHYKNNKDIELISISLDTNKNKWLNKLKEDKPKWHQFICPDNFNSQLCKNYDIDAIPRFLFFDKDGRILSLNAPRPSDERIIKYIDENLK